MKVLMDTIINRNDDEVIKGMFTRVLAPFALAAKGLPVIYNGMPVENLKVSGSSESATFTIDGNTLIMVDFEAETVSAFGSKFVPVSGEDIRAIKFIIKTLEEKAKETNPLEEILKMFSQNLGQNN